MRVLFFLFLLLSVQSCATKKDIKKLMLPEVLKWGTEEIFVTVNNQKKLLHRRQIIFTKNGRIKYTKTVDSLGNLLNETQKKLWFTVQTYPHREPLYCKTRWKPNQCERVSCYSRKQDKQNEAIYHYNSDGTIDKITDNFTTFTTQYFYYTNKELSKISIKDKNDNLIGEILVRCESKDEKGTCLKEVRISSKTNTNKEILFSPYYD